MEETKTNQNNMTKGYKAMLFVKIAVMAFFVITTSGYALSTLDGSLYYHYLFLAVLIILFAILTGKNHKISSQLGIHHFLYMNLCFALLCSFIANMNIQYINYNIRYLITISFAFLFSNSVSKGDFIRYFIVLMKYIVIISLIAYIPTTFFNINPNLPLVENMNGVRYYNGILFFVFYGYLKGRNPGCFWEPGIFAAFIAFALIFEICFSKKLGRVNVIIFVLGLLSTQSTLGYFLLILTILLALTRNVKGVTGLVSFFIVVLGVILAYVNAGKILSYLVTVNPRVFSKLVDQTASFTQRVRSPLANLEVFARFPIFGAGIGNVDALLFQVAGGSQTSTSTYLLAAFGIFGIIYTLLWLYGILHIENISMLSKIIIVVMVLLILNTEPHCTAPRKLDMFWAFLT